MTAAGAVTWPATLDAMNLAHHLRLAVPADIDRLRGELKKAQEQGQREFDLAKAIGEIKTRK